MSQLILRGERGSLAGRQISVPASPFTIGRSPENQLVLAETQASRRHAQLELREGRWWLQDLGSSNGTSVNHQPLHPSQPVPLHDGDRIEIGEAVFAVVLQAAPAPRRAGPARAAAPQRRASPAIPIVAALVVVAVIAALVWVLVSRTGKKEEATPEPGLPGLKVPEITLPPIEIPTVVLPTLEIPTGLPVPTQAGGLIEPLQTALPGLKLPLGTPEP